MMSGTDDFNPFEDPSITTLKNQSGSAQVETYNPFDAQKSEQKSSPRKEISVTIPISSSEMQQPAENPPVYSNSGAQKAVSNDLQRRQEELERKANELQEREERLNALPATGSTTNKNWPPLPAKCCVGPCFYQDIGVEIPIAYQKTVRTMYYLWWCYAVLLFLNMLGALALFISNMQEGVTFGISILLFILFSPASYVCWFRPLYKAFRADSSFNFMVFFFVFFFQFCVAVFYAIGIPQMGSCGLLNGITILSQGGEHKVDTVAIGIIAIVIGFLWAMLALVSFYLLCVIHRMYRGTTASFAKAQEELASGVVRNQHVQAAAAQAATQVVQQSLNTAASGLRY